MITTWADTGPAWLGAVGGILGAFASVVAVRVAWRAEQEHVSWLKVTTKTNSRGMPTGYEIVNGAKKTEAIVESIADVTGDQIDALDTFTELPLTIAPGLSFPVAISRSLANSYPTVVELTWRERTVNSHRVKRRARTVRLYM
jgi:hypothetical protein